MLEAAKKKPPTPPDVLAIHRDINAQTASMSRQAVTYSQCVALQEQIRSTLKRMEASRARLPNPPKPYQFHFDIKFHAFTRLLDNLARRFNEFAHSLPPPPGDTPITPITLTTMICRCKDSHSPCTYKQLELRVQASIPGSKLCSVECIHAPHLAEQYKHYCNTVLLPRCKDGLNEKWMYHGTRATPPDVLIRKHGDEGLEPRLSVGGLCGYGTYLAEDACYVARGRYGFQTAAGTVKFLVVKTAFGTTIDLGQRVDAYTRSLRAPPIRISSVPPVKYGSVIGGPHRPHVAGIGPHSSKIACVYKSEQMLPVYILEIEMPPELPRRAPTRVCNRNKRARHT